jgi:hypothetical protein
MRDRGSTRPIVYIDQIPFDERRAGQEQGAPGRTMEYPWIGFQIGREDTDRRFL